MKHTITGIILTLTIVGSGIFAAWNVVSLLKTINHPAATTTAPITTHKQPATGAHVIPPPPIKEAEKDCATCKSTSSPAAGAQSTKIPISPTSAAATTRIAIASTLLRNKATSVRVAQPARTSLATASASPSATNDPYRDSMLPGGSQWVSHQPAADVSVDVLNASSPNPDWAALLPDAANAVTSLTTSKNSAPNVRRVPTSTKANTGVLSTPLPAPPLPDWTHCSTSWSQTLTLGKSGEQIWTFSTTLSDADVQDLATSVRWYADIVAKYPTVARNYAWLDCAGWRVRDYHQHASNVPPADYFGAQGLDSPLGTCHSTTPFRRAGAGRCSQQSDELGCSAPGAMSTLGVLGGTKGDDDKVRGWVRWHGDWYVGIVEDATCTDQCVVGFDHPCDLSEETEQPARRWDAAGKMFYSWWYGGDPNREPPW